MMDREVATYGEENRLWTGDEARATGARVIQSNEKTEAMSEIQS